MPARRDALTAAGWLLACALSSTSDLAPAVGSNRTAGRTDTQWVPPARDGTGIRAAIDALDDGGVVRLGAGTYRCRRPIRLDGSVWLVGSGRSTVLQFEGGFDPGMVVVPADAQHSRVSSLTIDGHDATSGDCLVLLGYNYRPLLDRLVLRGGPRHGIAARSGDDEYVYEPVVTDVDVKGVAANGFNLSYVADLFGADLYAETTGGAGLKLMDAGGVIVHPHAYDASGPAGVVVAESARDLRLYAPFLDTNRRHGGIVRGRRIVLHGTFAYDNAAGDPGNFDGLVLDGASRSLVTGGVFANKQATSQRYGIAERGDARKNLVALNQLVGNVRGGLDQTGSSGSQVFGNVQ
ncbi:MAG: hypothetical protein ABEI77_00305 [Halorientalis sp.]